MDAALSGDELVRSAGLPVSRTRDERGFLVGESEGALDLRPPGEHGRRGIQALFPPDRGEGGRPLVARAFGRRIVQIHDLTAGLGADAFRLARAGYSVRAWEREAAVFAVLVSGWQRACRLGHVSAEVAERLEFVRGEGRVCLSTIDGLDQGVYVDPMYPPSRRRSAKPRRDLQVLRALLGGQDDAAALVDSARARASRVVVKRPHHASPLVEGVSFELESKLVRFDVYVNPARIGEASG